MKFFWILLLCAGSAFAGALDDFFSAVKNDDSRTVTNLLFRGFDPNSVDAKGYTGLLYAVREGSLKVATLLLSQNKTLVEARTPQDENVLMMAALAGNEALAKALIDKGADVNKPGWAPLHYAATKGHAGITKLLLGHHAYIDAESPNKSTPLMMAAMYGTFDVVKLLVDEGADTSLKNEQGLTAHDFAKKAERQDIQGYLAKVIESRRPKGAW
jgi:ankyrin repeat protein